MSWNVLVGDCVDRLAELPEASIDAVVCDPPYGLEFMGKAWDSFRIDDRQVPGYNGRESGSHGEVAPTGDPDTLGDRLRVGYGGGKRATTYRCEGCGKRDQFRKPHTCAEGTNWRTELVDPYAAPPTMLAFQNWTRTWALEALRVLKPGGHLLAFGGSRTAHRLAAGLEDAGFEIRDTIQWLYGSGFPKSSDLSKAIDKRLTCRCDGVETYDGLACPTCGKPRLERQVVGRKPDPRWNGTNAAADERELLDGLGPVDPDSPGALLTSPATPQAEPWQGWGTALKPAYEPIVVARKPPTGTLVDNVLEYGVGGLNIDGCRVAFAGAADEAKAKDGNRHADWGSSARENAVYGADDRARADQGNYDAAARWPANVVLTHDPGCELRGVKRVRTSTGESLGDPDGHGIYGSGFPRGDGRTVGYADDDGREAVEDWDCVPGCPVRLLDEQSGEGGGRGGQSVVTYGSDFGIINDDGWQPKQRVVTRYDDAGGASRFFYCAKASRAEREAGLADLPEQAFGASNGAQSAIGDGDDYGGGSSDIGLNRTTRRRNVHPTVKPLDLMRWLVRLVTPAGGVVLDPFLGSGTTGCAAVLEGFDFVGVEREAEYAPLAEARIRWWAEQPDGIAVDDALRSEADRRRISDAGQLDFFAAPERG